MLGFFTFARNADIICRAETLDAGKLREAAEWKNDEKLLVLIRGRDCVAVEVQYHQTCYQSYTKSQYNDDRVKYTDGETGVL